MTKIFPPLDKFRFAFETDIRIFNGLKDSKFD